MHALRSHAEAGVASTEACYTCSPSSLSGRKDVLASGKSGCACVGMGDTVGSVSTEGGLKGRAKGAQWLSPKDIAGTWLSMS